MFRKFGIGLGICLALEAFVLLDALAVFTGHIQ